MRIGQLCFALVFSLCAATVTFADALDDADKAYQAGDYATALNIIKPLAEQGDSGAQHNLGVLYSKGLGVPQDYQEAVAWFRRAAEQGNSGAQNALGAMYYFGNGVPQDFVSAYALFNLSASQGNKKAISARSELTKILTASQIEEGQRLSRSWMSNQRGVTSQLHQSIPLAWDMPSTETIMLWAYLVGMGLVGAGAYGMRKILSRRINQTPQLVLLGLLSGVSFIALTLVGFYVFEWWVPVVGHLFAPIIIYAVSFWTGFLVFLPLQILFGLLLGMAGLYFSSNV